jgi:uncharacterized protein YbgA (DUF1722 family)/uncharacterized protein YbbK (DUF523 family)
MSSIFPAKPGKGGDMTDEAKSSVWESTGTASPSRPACAGFDAAPAARAQGDGPIRLGVSRCLLGENVRYDGGHKLDRFVRDELGRFVAFVPVCPEVECGLPVPRQAMRLTGDPAAPRLVTIKTGVDLTGKMTAWAARRLDELAAEDLCGFVFKSGSPSSGMERVKVYRPDGYAAKAGVGIFARLFMERFPLIPCEDEGRLHDPGLRENFIERVFTMKRLREAMSTGKPPGSLVAFHGAHKLLLMSHGPAALTRLGRLVAEAGSLDPDDLFCRYAALLSQALKLEATTRKQVNTLMHAMGYFKKVLTSEEKHELLEIIDHYAKGHVPLIVPVTMLKHYTRKYGQTYLASQVYLNPHPVELGLRNHA